MPNPVLLLGDNWYDNVVLHKSYTVSNPDADDVTGNEIFRVADNLRDLTWWTPSGTNAIRKLRVIGLAAVTAPTLLVLDRNHNLGGLAGVTLQSSTDNFATVTTTEATFTIPTVVGGLPTDVNGCVTAAGVWVKEFSGLNTRTAWQLNVPAMGVGIAPIVTGLYLGVYYRLPAGVYPDAVSAWDSRAHVAYTKNQMSRRGFRVKMQPIRFAELRFKVALDGTDYPAFNAEMDRLLTYNAPWWICQDDSDATMSGQTRLFQLPGEITFDPIPSPIHREIDFTLEEVAPAVIF